MVSYIWPKDDREVKTRVVAAMGLLVSAKMINTSVPFIFRSENMLLVVWFHFDFDNSSFAIDSLNAAQQLNLDTPEAAVGTLVTSTLLGNLLQGGWEILNCNIRIWNGKGRSTRVQWSKVSDDLHKMLLIRSL